MLHSEGLFSVEWFLPIFGVDPIEQCDFQMILRPDDTISLLYLSLPSSVAWYPPNRASDCSTPATTVRAG
eukprot:SAG22_NODE_2044_length_3089_cov_2.202341_2_plen_70_part_00